MRPGGVLVSVAAPPAPDEAARRGARGMYFVVEPDRGQLETIRGLVDSARITPIVDRVVHFADARAGYEHPRTEPRQGKVVLHVAG